MYSTSRRTCTTRACHEAEEPAVEDAAPWSINFQITSGTKFRELKLRDILVSAAAESRLWKLIRRDLSKQIAETCPDDRDSDWVEEQLGKADKEYQAFDLTDEGLVVSYSHYAFGHSVLDSTIPYRQLRGILRKGLFPPERPSG